MKRNAALKNASASCHGSAVTHHEPSNSKNQPMIGMFGAWATTILPLRSVTNARSFCLSILLPHQLLRVRHDCAAGGSPSVSVRNYRMLTQHGQRKKPGRNVARATPSPFSDGRTGRCDPHLRMLLIQKIPPQRCGGRTPHPVPASCYFCWRLPSRHGLLLFSVSTERITPTHDLET